jgi:hypothetical protein
MTARICRRFLGIDGVLACGLALAACSKDSPAGPSGQQTISGQTLNVLDDAQAGNVTLQIGAINAQSDAAGFFEATVEDAGHYPAVMRGNGFVERRTSVSAPAGGLRLSLIPAGFDLRAFDELCRTSNSRLQRWTARPKLAVVTSVLRFTGEETDFFNATAERLSGGDVDGLIADLRGALALLTSGTWDDFEQIERENVSEGTVVSATRPFTIVVARYQGISEEKGVIGYGRWAEQGDGTVVGGSVYLDRGFDTNDGRRRLLRTHELGHALGYTHVTAQPSIMNPAMGPEPTDFDRQAVRIAFNRSPGNRAPDDDPGFAGGGSSGGTTIRTGDPAVRWSPPVP